MIVTSVHRVWISRIVGKCPLCGAPVLDCGYSDDSQLWEHDWASIN